MIGKHALTKIQAVIIAVIIVVAVVAGVAAYLATRPPAAPVKEEILIGASVSLTGHFAKFGEEQHRTYKIWEEHINKEGGIYVKEYGKKLPVRVIIYDDKSDAETAAKLYEKLITVDHVDFVLAPFSSTISYAVSVITEKYKVPLICSYAASPSLYNRGYKYLFSVQPIATHHMESFINMCATFGAKTAAVVAPKIEWSMHVAKGAVDLCKKYGIEVVLYEEYEAKPKDLTPLVLKIKEKNPDILAGATYYDDAVLLTRQMMEMGVRPKAIFLANAPQMPGFKETFGKTAEGLCDFYTAPRPVDCMPDWFLKAYKEKYGRDPSGFVCLTFATCQILQQAIEKAGTLDRDKVRNVLATEVFETIKGKSKFREDGQDIYAKTWVIQIQNGKNEVVWPPGPFQTAKPIYPLSPEWPS